jgi:hypothetical protein
MPESSVFLGGSISIPGNGIMELTKCAILRDDLTVTLTESLCDP